MPNPAGFGELGFDNAVLEVEMELRRRLPERWRRLRGEELNHYNRPSRFVRGWRIGVEFSDAVTREIDVLIGRSFPAGYPRTALVDGPGHLIWPHVEADGILCLLPIMADVDAETPGRVTWELFRRSVVLIEELLEGSIIDRDFREEFLTYWAYAAGGVHRVQSLLDIDGRTRTVSTWRANDGSIIIGENDASLSRWLKNRYGPDCVRGKRRIERGAIISLPQPPLPSQYPANGAEVVDLAATAGEDAVRCLLDVAASLPKELTVLFRAEGRGGPGLFAVSTRLDRKRPDRDGRAEQPILKGFRRDTLPEDVAALRTYSHAPVVKSNVARADPAWIHGRGKDPRSAILLGKTVTLIGCGSVGSSVAARLARSGVGTLNLIDPEEFSWSNLGRHELGAASVGLNKAEELQKKFQSEFPHLRFVSHPATAQWAIDEGAGVLRGSDIIIAATASWNAEGALNRWHLAQGRRMPIVYGWTETHAVAGHAVVIGDTGSCLRCGMDSTGQPLSPVSNWEAATTATLEEPACGNHFTPYGAMDLSFVVDMIAQTALDILLKPGVDSYQRLWVAPKERLQAAGGSWTEDFERQHPHHLQGGALLERPWPNSECPACGSKREAISA